MKRRLLILFACSALAAPLFAAEGEAPEKDMTLWKWANFVVLVGILGYIGTKAAKPFFAGQTEKIRRGLEDAEKQKAESDAKVAEISRRLANLETEIAAIRAAGQRERDASAAALRENSAAEIARIQASSEQAIDSMSKAARNALQEHAARLALGLAARKARARMNPDLQSRLSGEFIDRVSGSGGPQRLSNN